VKAIKFPLNREDLSGHPNGSVLLAIMLQIMVDTGQIDLLKAEEYFDKYRERDNVNA
jgi:hypothetical protein